MPTKREIAERLYAAWRAAHPSTTLPATFAELKDPENTAWFAAATEAEAILAEEA